MAQFEQDVMKTLQNILSRLDRLETIEQAAAGTDANAIHDNVAAEISAVTEKTAPTTSDIVLIEDAAAANVKKKVQLGNLSTFSNNVNVGGGLRVGDLTAPTDNDIRAVSSIVAGEGLYVGGVAGEPGGTGIIIATDDARIGGGLVVGNTTTNRGAGYANIINGLRVGDTAAPTNDDIRATADISAGGGLYAGSVGGEPATGDVHYTANLVSRKNSQDHDVYGFHMITEAEGILCPWDGSGAGLSDVTAALIDVSTDFNGTAGHEFPVATAGIKAYVLNWAIRDSASAGNSTYVQLSPTNSNTYSTAFGSEGRTNDKFDRGQVIILPNSDGDFYMWREATGTGTMDLYISIVGYFV